MTDAELNAIQEQYFRLGKIIQLQSVAESLMAAAKEHYASKEDAIANVLRNLSIDFLTVKIAAREAYDTDYHADTKQTHKRLPTHACSLYSKGVNIFPDIYGEDWKKYVPVEGREEIVRQNLKTLSGISVEAKIVREIIKELKNENT